jgi:hypothetical protein
MMTDEETQAEIARLHKMAKARKTRPGFAENVLAIHAKIADLSTPPEPTPDDPQEPQQ